ncbi:hypothetical protein ACF0H5_002911 [Mactra antiquata]
MCDIHGRKLEYFCLHHEDYCCGKCKHTDHAMHPCECLHVRDVYDRLQLEMEEHVQDLIRLRERSQRILDGSYQRNLLYRVNDEEIHLDKFYKDMKRKLKETKLKIKAFTADELSEHLRQQLNALVTKPTPKKFSKSERPKDMVQQMKHVKKLVRGVNGLLYSLPNYIEITVDSKFTKLLSYNNDPVVIRGRPKFMSYTQVSDDEFVISEDDDDETSELDENFDKFSDGNPDGKKRRNITYKAKEHQRVSNGVIFDDGADNTDSLSQIGVLKWNNNAPSFTLKGTTTRPAQNNILPAKRENKYEKQIAAVKERLRLPPVSLTPQPVKNRRENLTTNKSSRSMPDNELTDRPKEKLFLRHSKKFVVRDKIKLDGCEDALVLKDFIVLSMIDKVKKIDRKSLKLNVEMKLANCSTMCPIVGSQTQFALLQLQKCITVLDAQYGLTIVYKISIKQPYIDLCHIGNRDDGPIHPSFVFATVYKCHPKQPVNCVDIVHAKAVPRPGRPPVYDVIATGVEIADDNGKIKEIHGISGFADGHIVLGTGNAVMCINETGKIVWKTPAPRSVSGVFCTKSLIYVCIQDVKKVVTFNKAGFVTDENVLSELDVIPCKLSANWDVLLVKDYKSKSWTSVSFKQGLFII